MLKLVGLVLLLLVLGVAGLTSYLSVDDLKNCEVSPTDDKKCLRADAIVAISGGDTVARTKEAIDLYKSGWADTLIFSGAAQDTSGPSNAEVMRRQAVNAGIDTTNILTEELSQTTKQNADRTKTLFDDRNINRVILVTSPYHQRRASLEFRARAGSAIMIVNHPTTYDNDWSSWWWLSPRGWWLTGGEVVKIIAFYIGGSR